MSEFTPIETQEQFDAAISDRIKREKETISKKYEKYLSPEQVQQQKSELEDRINEFTAQLNEANEKKASLEQSIADKDKEIKGYKTASLKSKIANEAGLPYDAANFLKGEDEEAIRQSAEALKGLVGTPETPPLASTEPCGGDKDAALRQTLRNLNKGE